MSSSTRRLPAAIGGYRILRLLGEGGMGIVYEAEQPEPRRLVALKVIRGAHQVDDNHVRLFQREAQALARLRHPGIAAIYESGNTADGQHFFAMELVRGETLGAHLGHRQAPHGLGRDELRHRLGLFRRICDAVSYAHQRGVIHRDLKPSNIFVQREVEAAPSELSGHLVPQIKILDFGLAKITDTDVAASTMVSTARQVAGTLPYMSPEQVRGNADEIDVRTDIYSLGVVLYELLAGRLPHGSTRVSLAEAARLICEAPPRPLGRLGSIGRGLNRELAIIVRKALEKEPARRYQSVAALSEDVGRCLAGQPILARPPSALYQIGRLVARHRLGFAFAASLVLLLPVFAVTMTVQAGRLARERDRAGQEAETARQTAGFLVGLFAVADPSEARGNSITAREILDRGASGIEEKLKDQPLTQARMMETMGRVYTGLGLYREATPLLTKTVEVRSRELGEAHADTIRALHSLGELHVFSGEYAEGRKAVERALAISERTHGPDHLETAWGRYWLGSLLSDRGDPGAAELLESAQRVFERNLGPDDLAVALCLNDRAIAIMTNLTAENARRALPLMERAQRIRELRLGLDHPESARGLNNVGTLLVYAEDYAKAKPILERAVALNERVLGPNHPFLALDSLHSFGELLRQTGSFEEAQRVLQRALVILEPPDGPPHPDSAVVLTSLAELHRDMHRPGEAEAFYRRALAARQRSPAGDHVVAYETFLDHYAEVLRDLGRVDEAARMTARAREAQTQILPEESGP